MAQSAKIVQPSGIRPETAEPGAEPESLLTMDNNHSLDAAAVQNLMGTITKLGQLSDKMHDPELLKLLSEVQTTGESLRLLLVEVNRLQESGVIDTLVQLAVMVQSVKDSLTPAVVTDLMGQAVRALTILDHLQTSGADDLLLGMLDSIQETMEEQKNKEPQSFFGLLRQLNRDPQAKRGLNIMVGFLQKLALRM